MHNLTKFLTQFRKLRRAHNNGGAPHKPILLLAILSGIEKGEIANNRISITPELVISFKEIWQILVNSAHISTFALPFFHMRSEPFWKLVSLPGAEIAINNSHSFKSFAALRSSVAYAEINSELFQLMMKPIEREIFRESILSQYFPTTKHNLSSNKGKGIIYNIEQEILHTKASEYQEKYQQLKLQLNQEELEEETFIRGGVFKREIPKLYKQRCAISGMRIISSNNAQMVDACHIIPFSNSNDDTVGNGISLSPNLHRAFDRGLITINNDYRVRVSPSIKEDHSPFSLSQFEGKEIILPEKIEFHPLKENLVWHQNQVWIN